MSISVLNTDAALSGKTLMDLETAQTVTALKSFSRSTNPPFAVNSGAASVTNLDADKIDGIEGADIATLTGTQTLTNKTLTAPTVSAPVITGTTDLSGGQVKFPAAQSASSNVNTLDDYEEGTWTPVIGGSGGTSGQTYAKQQGTYVKIGKLVIAPFYVEFTAKGTITTNAQLQGLPFTSDSAPADGHSIFISWSAAATGMFSAYVVISASSTVAGLYYYAGASTSPTTMTTTEIGNSTIFAGTLMYRASA